MSTPAQQAKDYAAANGFTIEAVGRRYKVTHVATGTVFERGGYAALLNEMRFAVNTLKSSEPPGWQVIMPPSKTFPEGLTLNVKQAPASADEVSNAAMREYCKADVTIAELLRPAPILGDFHLRYPWKVYCAGFSIGAFGSRADAVTELRREYNRFKRGEVHFYGEPFSARIVYKPNA